MLALLMLSCLVVDRASIRRQIRLSVKPSLEASARATPGYAAAPSIYLAFHVHEAAGRGFI